MLKSYENEKDPKGMSIGRREVKELSLWSIAKFRLSICWKQTSKGDWEGASRQIDQPPGRYVQKCLKEEGLAVWSVNVTYGNEPGGLTSASLWWIRRKKPGFLLTKQLPKGDTHVTAISLYILPGKLVRLISDYNE